MSCGPGEIGIFEPGPESDSPSGSPFWVKWLRQLWDYDWGEVHATSPILAVASASLGLFVALCVGAWNFLEGEAYVQSAADFLHAGMGVGAIAAVVYVVALVLTPSHLSSEGPRYQRLRHNPALFIPRPPPPRPRPSRHRTTPSCPLIGSGHLLTLTNPQPCDRWQAPHKGGMGRRLPPRRRSPQDQTRFRGQIDPKAPTTRHFDNRNGTTHWFRCGSVGTVQGAYRTPVPDQRDERPTRFSAVPGEHRIRIRECRATRLAPGACTPTVQLFRLTSTATWMVLPESLSRWGPVRGLTSGHCS